MPVEPGQRYRDIGTGKICTVVAIDTSQGYPIVIYRMDDGDTLRPWALEGVADSPSWADWWELVPTE